MKYKDLDIRDLINGYSFDKDKNSFECIFCGEQFYSDEIYNINGKLYSAEGAIKQHIFQEHESVFSSLIKIDKTISGLSDTQTDILACMFDGRSNSEISDALGITSSTVRSHKFNLQKQKTQAKIFLAILELAERNAELKKLATNSEELNTEELNLTDFEESNDNSNRGYSLHPFFTKYNLR